MARVKRTPKRISPLGQPFAVRANAWRFNLAVKAWEPYTRVLHSRVYKTASRVELALQLNAFETDMVKCQLNFDRC